MQLFRGYVPTKDKQCLEKFKGRKRLNTLEEVQDLDEYAAILGDETILIDVDNAETSELLLKTVGSPLVFCPMKPLWPSTRGQRMWNWSWSGSGRKRKKQWNRRRITPALLGMFRKKILMVMKAGTNNPRLPYMPGQ